MLETKRALIGLLSVMMLLVAACTSTEGESETTAPATGETVTTGNGGSESTGSMLETVLENDMIRCGTRDALPGFAVLQDDGSHVGFDSDFCRVIAAAVLGDAEKVEHVDLETADRFTALQSGQIDVLVRNTTWTASRDGGEGATFLTVTYYDGQAMMVAADSPYQSVSDMAGSVVCVTKGTTTEGNAAGESARLGLDWEVRPFDDTDLLQEAFLAGQCDGWSSDSSQLVGLRSAYPDGADALRILPEVFSKEPLAPAVLDGDTEWAQVVNWAIMATIQAEEFGITQANVDEMLNSEDTRIRSFLGAEYTDSDGNVTVTDPGLGLPTDFAYQVVKQVGNYGEIFERHLAPLGLERGVNALWVDGGLLYVPPYRSKPTIGWRSVRPPPDHFSMTTTAGPSARIPFYRDVRVLKWVFQVGVFAVVAAVLYWLWGNYRVNTESSGIPTSFDFLGQPTNFDIPGADFSPQERVQNAYVIGLLNTIRVSVVGIVLATILGILIGIGRLSSNWVVSKLSTVYVEMVRNLPLLVILTFVVLGLVLQAFPRIEDAWTPFGWLVFSNRGMGLPWYQEVSGLSLLVLFAFGIGGWWALARWRHAVSDRTGAPARSGLYGGTFLVISVVTGWLVLGGRIDLPTVDGPRVTGGIGVDPSFFAVLVALVVYTASHIAEIVRGSIQAIPKGQGEAASALALSGFQRMWNVILPQAMRIAIPPLGNQYLNLIKNSSLAAGFAYFDITNVTQITVGNGSPAVPAFTLALMFYVALSLITSVFVNIANRRFKLVER